MSKTIHQNPKSPKMAARRAAREVALHLVYERSYDTDTAAALTENRLSKDGFAMFSDETDVYGVDLPENEKEYVRRITEGVEASENELRNVISKHSQNWKLERITRICNAIMKIAMYEMLYIPDIDTGVSINEAVELAKKYDSQEAAAFINGILGGFAKECAPTEQTEPPE